MFELGDGLLGTYGVDSILEQEDIRKVLTGVVLSANDPVAAYGAWTYCASVSTSNRSR